MTIRVLHLGSPQGLFGAERWILALLRHLDRSRIESHVGVILDESGLDAPLLREASRFDSKTMSIEAIGRFNPSAISSLRRYLIHNRIDILHTHFYKTDIVGALATLGTRCKTVTTPHGWSTGAGMGLRLYEAMDRAIFRFFDAVVPLSHSLHDDLKGLGSRLRYIQNGVDIAEIDSVAQPPASTTPEQTVIGYVGQLIPRKGLVTLIQALALLDDANARLVLVGEGEQRVELEALASDLGVRAQVVFMGYRSDRLSLMKTFHMFVLPSLLEGIPRCLMEAMAAGVPVIASDIPGSTQLVEHGRTGLLFRAGSAEELAACIRRMQGNDRTPMVRAAREHIVAEFSAAAMAARYMDLYRELVPA